MSALKVVPGRDRGFPFEIEDAEDGSRLAKFCVRGDAEKWLRAVNDATDKTAALPRETPIVWADIQDSKARCRKVDEVHEAVSSLVDALSRPLNIAELRP